MLSRLLCGSAVALFLAGPALAQAEKPATGSSATNAPATMSSSAASSATTTGSGEPFMTVQGSDHILADDLVGSNVMNASQEKVGSVDDLILDNSGKVIGVVISVGGFLGIGEKHVAVGWDKLQSRSSEGFVVNWTKDELKQAPEFKTATTVKNERESAAQRSQVPAAGAGGIGSSPTPANTTPGGAVTTAPRP